MSFIKSKSKGHVYFLFNADDPHRTQPQTLQFIKKEKSDVPGELTLVHNGTTNEAVIDMLIDRLTYLNGLLASEHNEKAIEHLEAAKAELVARTEARQKAGVEGTAKDLDGKVPGSEEEELPAGPGPEAEEETTEETQQSDEDDTEDADDTAEETQQEEESTDDSESEDQEYGEGTPIPEDCPHDAHIRNAGVVTCEELTDLAIAGKLTDLNQISENRATDIIGWLEDNEWVVQD